MKNRSGSTSVVVVDKHGGKFKKLHTIGIGHDNIETEALCVKGQKWIKNHLGMLELDFEGPAIKDQEVKAAETVLNNIRFNLVEWSKADFRQGIPYFKGDY